MKKMLLILGIVCIAACVLFLLFAALQWFGYYHVLDGSSELYDRLHRRGILYSIIGIALAAIGTTCMIIHAKI